VADLGIDGRGGTEGVDPPPYRRSGGETPQKLKTKNTLEAS